MTNFPEIKSNSDLRILEYRIDHEKHIILTKNHGHCVVQEYATHRYDPKTGDIYWGHYYADLEEAVEDFNSR